MDAEHCEKGQRKILKFIQFGCIHCGVGQWDEQSPSLTRTLSPIFKLWPSFYISGSFLALFRLYFVCLLLFILLRSNLLPVVCKYYLRNIICMPEIGWQENNFVPLAHVRIFNVWSSSRENIPNDLCNTFKWRMNLCIHGKMGIYFSQSHTKNWNWCIEQPGFVQCHKINGRTGIVFMSMILPANSIEPIRNFIANAKFGFTLPGDQMISIT